MANRALFEEIITNTLLNNGVKDVECKPSKLACCFNGTWMGKPFYLAFLWRELTLDDMEDKTTRGLILDRVTSSFFSTLARVRQEEAHG